ncbi:hypothetical protein C0993_005935 [Termitomyces sp. T159_Od127]|nr:hypothetical protein C0993_005935 [Termitomyces sp. T159_Od127]
MDCSVTRGPGWIPLRSASSWATCRSPAGSVPSSRECVSVAPAPLTRPSQVVENIRRQSCAGLALPFLANWLLGAPLPLCLRLPSPRPGDVSNLVGCILTHQLPFQTYLAVYFVFVDIALVVQYCYYSLRHPRPLHSTRTSVDRVRYRALSAVAASVAASAALAAQQDEHPRRRPSISWSIGRSRSIGREDRGRPLEREVRDPEPGRLHSKARAGSVVFLAVCALFGFAQSRRAPRTGVVLSPRADEAPLDERTIGRVFAWLCTTLYLTSRLPQIWKNYVRKSVEGLSMYLFVFAFLGNSFYVASILTSPALQTPAFLAESIPYLLGSGGTLMFDVVIVSQSFIYRPRVRRWRALVLDYLAHCGCTNTAAAFASESSVRHLTPDGDELPVPGLPHDELAAIHRRNQIYHLIQSGRVDDATRLLTSHFPAVLAGPAPDRPRPAGPRRIADAIPYAPATSTDPRHVALNLRILAFIEACRTRPLPGDDAVTTCTDQMTLLKMAQKLLAHAQMLPDDADRKTYSAELNNVGGLLAYKVPEESPMKRYLAQERRDAVADQVHRAILEHSGVCSVSALELLVRYTATVWRFANKMDAKPRPGALLPPTQSKEPETVPPFDLGVFLDHTS